LKVGDSDASQKHDQEKRIGKEEVDDYQKYVQIKKRFMAPKHKRKRT